MQKKYQTQELVTLLQGLVEGLTWMSETDAPLHVLYWDNSMVLESNEQLLQHMQHPRTAVVGVGEVDQFFEPAVAEQDWFGEEEKETAARYRSLLSVLKQHLSHLKVYRVGEVEIDVYVLGRTEADSVVGIATQIVET